MKQEKINSWAIALNKMSGGDEGDGGNGTGSGSGSGQPG